MNSFSRRALQRIGVGAVALAAATSVAGLTASPAHAGDATDLGVAITGETITAGADFKFVSVTITNHGPGVASGVVLHLDLSQLIATQVAVNLTDEGCTDKGSGKFDCPIGAEDVPASGGSTDWAYRFEPQGGAVQGPAGTFTVSVSHDGTDAVEANNSDSADIAIGPAGQDLSVYADDVRNAWKLDSDGFPAFDEDGPIEDGLLTPGKVGHFVYLVFNHGAVQLSGATTSISLPENVEFAFQRDECTYSDDNRTAQCTFPNLPMVPASQDELGEGEFRGWFISEPVAVAEGVTAPASLTGGEVSAEGIAEAPSIMSRSVATTPEGVAGATKDDIDPTDNTDEFTVFVAAKPGSGGSLPITGVQVGLIGGAGAAAVAVGAVLLFASRRRRITEV